MSNHRIHFRCEMPTGRKKCSFSLPPFAIAQSDVTPYLRNGLGGNVEKRCDILQRKQLHNLRTSGQEFFVTTTGIQPVIVKKTRIGLREKVFGNKSPLMAKFGIIEIHLQQISSIYHIHFARHVRLYRHFRLMSIEAVGVISHELAFKSKACNITFTPPLSHYT